MSSGLTFPLKPNRLGRLNVTKETLKIQQNLEQIVHTALRERWYEEDMGSQGVSLLFRNPDEQALVTIAFLIEGSLNVMEPRARSKVIIPKQESDGTLTIAIQYKIKETQATGRVVVELN